MPFGPIYKKMKKTPFILLILLGAGLITLPSAHADVALIAQGLAKTLYAVAQVPASMLAGSTHAFPFGLITGAVTGTVKMAAGTVMGAADMARGTAPYAKYAIFAL